MQRKLMGDISLHGELARFPASTLNLVLGPHPSQLLKPSHLPMAQELSAFDCNQYLTNLSHCGMVPTHGNSKTKVCEIKFPLLLMIQFCTFKILFYFIKNMLVVIN